MKCDKEEREHNPGPPLEVTWPPAAQGSRRPLLSYREVDRKNKGWLEVPNFELLEFDWTGGCVVGAVGRVTPRMDPDL